MSSEELTSVPDRMQSRSTDGADEIYMSSDLRSVPDRTQSRADEIDRSSEELRSVRNRTQRREDRHTVQRRSTGAQRRPDQFQI
jgi:hypothetical protein